MPSVPARILADLDNPGRTLAFCDETDITHEATTTMLPHIHLWAAWVVPSVLYGEMRDSLDGYRRERELPEFHANEIVTPGTESAWKIVSHAERIAAFAFACRLVVRPECTLRYVHIPRQQYDQIRDGLPKGAIPKSHKSAVKKVFVDCIVDALRDAAPATLILDKDKAGSQPTLSRVPEGGHLEGGGAVNANSASVAGLQLADVAAYAVGRYVRRRDRIITGKKDAFDELAMTAVSALNGRFTSLLSG